MRFLELWILVVVLLVTITTGIIVYVQWAHPQTIYDQLVRDGYEGSAEQLIASLVGETVDKSEKTAYQLACEKGYDKSQTEWNLTFVERETVAEDNMFLAASAAGYNGSMEMWLSSLCKNPENLGRSNLKGEKTEYELACEYGYEGTFIQWLISVASDPIL